MSPEYPAGWDNRFGAATESANADLKRFVALLAEWQTVHNLVAGDAMENIWTRHVSDSLQLLDHAAEFHQWVDLGSGAGFPGLVVAIASKPHTDRHFTLVESNTKKAAFLRAAIRQAGANASVAAERIETHGPKMAGQADVVSARALAPLDRLLALARPYLHTTSVLLLLKGRNFAEEREIAAESWNLDVVISPSRTDPEGQVASIRNISPKVRRT